MILWEGELLPVMKVRLKFGLAGVLVGVLILLTGGAGLDRLVGLVAVTLACAYLAWTVMAILRQDGAGRDDGPVELADEDEPDDEPPPQRRAEHKRNKLP